MYTNKMRRSLMNRGFTRRHYEFMAEVISSLPPRTRKQVAEAFAIELGHLSDGFDGERFRKACKI